MTAAGRDDAAYQSGAVDPAATVLRRLLEDAAAGRQDLQVAGAPLTQHDLGLPAPAEQQVRVRIHEPRRDGATGRVDHVPGVR